MTNDKQQTAVDKANELIDKMTKPYALIAVDEILKCHIWKFNSIEPYKYWQEVKQEIENYDKQ
jgi:hypothetical protein